MLKKLIGLAVIFVMFYLGAHFYLRWKNTVTDDVTKIGRLVECQPNDARKLKIEQRKDGRSEELVFERYDQPAAGVPAMAAVAQWHWKMKTPVSGEADPVALRRIVSTLCELYDPIPVRAEELRPETASRRLGHRLEAGFADGSSAAVEFGLLADRATVIRYKNARGAERIVRIPDHLLEVVSLPSEDYRNLKVVRTEADDTQQVTLSIDGKERFTLERAGADWKVSLGEKDLGEGSAEAGKFLNRASTVRALDVDAEGFSEADCAAMPAKAVLTFRDIMGRPEVARFAYGAKGDVSACSTLGSQKFRVHRDLIPFLDVPLKAIRAKK